MPIQYRSLSKEEQPAALELWATVYFAGSSYFKRYFDADPWYRAGDCLGAWDEGRLVSVVHVCRRPLSMNGARTWCGGIANVATLEEFRRRGLSRELLRRAISWMEETGISFSALGTGSFGHYGALGWQQVKMPCPTLTLSRETDIAPILDGAQDNEAPVVSEEVETIYGRSPRALQLERAGPYFSGWVGWSWQQPGRWQIMDPRSYAIVQIPSEPEMTASLLEWRAADRDGEEMILRRVAGHLLERKISRVRLEARPQFVELADYGAVEPTSRDYKMLRNISLDKANYDHVVALYGSGVACWWPADGF